jgi:hypothetical protein
MPEPCSTCGNTYDRAFEVVTADGERFTFDSLECAAHKVAPNCAHCGCRVLGHGVQADDTVYCCASCARSAGVDDTRDRSDQG